MKHPLLSQAENGLFIARCDLAGMGFSVTLDFNGLAIHICQRQGAFNSQIWVAGQPVDTLVRGLIRYAEGIYAEATGIQPRIPCPNAPACGNLACTINDPPHARDICKETVFGTTTKCGMLVLKRSN